MWNVCLRYFLFLHFLCFHIKDGIAIFRRLHRKCGDWQKSLKLFKNFSRYILRIFWLYIFFVYTVVFLSYRQIFPFPVPQRFIAVCELVFFCLSLLSFGSLSLCLCNLCYCLTVSLFVGLLFVAVLWTICPCFYCVSASLSH